MSATWTQRLRGMCSRYPMVTYRHGHHAERIWFAEHCDVRRLGDPTWQDVSDRRGKELLLSSPPPNASSSLLIPTQPSLFSGVIKYSRHSTFTHPRQEAAQPGPVSSSSTAATTRLVFGTMATTWSKRARTPRRWRSGTSLERSIRRLRLPLRATMPPLKPESTVKEDDASKGRTIGG
jgi:hypothetical protein